MSIILFWAATVLQAVNVTTLISAGLTGAAKGLGGLIAVALVNKVWATAKSWLRARKQRKQRQGKRP